MLKKLKKAAFFTGLMLLDLEEKLKVEQKEERDQKSRIAQIVDEVIESIEQGKPWKAYDRKETKLGYQAQVVYVPVPMGEQEQPKLKTEPYEKKWTSKTTEETAYASEPKTETENKQMNNERAAQMAERIRYGKFFGTLNDLTATDKEDWHHWTRSPINRVIRALADGSYANMKGYKTSM